MQSRSHALLFTSLTRPSIAVSGLLAALAVAASFAAAALPPVPVPPENPITEPKRVLGKILFWDEQLSTSNTVSCATCHAPATAGTDPRPPARNPGFDDIFNNQDDALGTAGVIRSDVNNNLERDPIFGLLEQVTGRSAVTTINAAYAPNMFWDGRATSRFTDPQTGQVAIQQGGALESQAVGPLMNDVEMAHESMDWDALAAKLARVRPLDLATNHPADVAAALADQPDYPELFQRAFGDGAITARRIAFAIATYERTLIADQTPFDSFRAGNNNALTPQQRAGFTEMQQHNCTVCHNAANDHFTDFSFRNVGLRPPVEDGGRQVVTGNFNDRGKFKVPSLRNVGLKRSYMHNGQIQTLETVLAFYARAQGAPPQFPENRDPVMQTININPQDRAAIVDFLRNGLTDPRVANQTFPFDRPTLFTNRPADRTTVLAGGVAGSGGITPVVLPLGPSMIGSLDYRIGLDRAVGGASATLGISADPPVSGRITPTQFVGTVVAQGAGNGAGLATLHWPLIAGSFQPGQVVFAQWFVTDPGASGGTALSNIARIPFFCGSSGCPSICAPDFNDDGFVTGVDFDLYVVAFESGDLTSDFDADGFVTGVDFDLYVQAYEAGC